MTCWDGEMGPDGEVRSCTLSFEGPDRDPCRRSQAECEHSDIGVNLCAGGEGASVRSHGVCQGGGQREVEEVSTFLEGRG